MAKGIGAYKEIMHSTGGHRIAAVLPAAKGKAVIGGVPSENFWQGHGLPNRGQHRKLGNMHTFGRQEQRRPCPARHHNLFAANPALFGVNPRYPPPLQIKPPHSAVFHQHSAARHSALGHQGHGSPRFGPRV